MLIEAWSHPMAACARRVTAVGSHGSIIAVGFSSGVLQIFDAQGGLISQDHRHKDALMSVAVVDDGDTVVTGGVDGYVVVSVSCGPRTASTAWLLLKAGRHGLHIEHLAATSDCWAALVGREVAVGPIGEAAVERLVYLGPLPNAADGLAIVGGGSIVAAASFGGLTLWRRHAPESGSETGCALGYLRAEPLAAARRSHVADLACDGWARSLVASPDGAWLAAGVTEASKTTLWLWRVVDGADFECGGLRGEVLAIEWSSDSHLCATCSTGTSTVFVWRFGARSSGADGTSQAVKRARMTPALGASGVRMATTSPAGQPPHRLRLSQGRPIALAFQPHTSAASVLACGGDDGAIELFTLQRGVDSVLLRWSPPTHRPAPPLDHLLWCDANLLIAASHDEAASDPIDEHSGEGSVARGVVALRLAL